MSETCNCNFTKDTLMVDKVRVKGFSQTPLPIAFDIECECGTKFKMINHEGRCPNCEMVYGVTPCLAEEISNVQAAGINY